MEASNTPPTQQNQNTSTARSQSEIAEPQWRRVHWVTPLLNAWQVVIVVLVIIISNVIDDLVWYSENADTGISPLLPVIGSLVVTLALLLVWFYLSWRYTDWAISADGVHYRHGILFKKHRKLPLNRIQSVDVRRTLAARIFGVGALRIESAGGSDSNIEIKFLRSAELDAARREIVAAAAGRRAPQADKPMATTHSAGTSQVTSQVASPFNNTLTQPPVQTSQIFAEDDLQLHGAEYAAYRVNNGRILGATLLSSGFVVTLVAAIVTLIGTMTALWTVDNTDQTGKFLVAGVLGWVISAGIVLLIVGSLLWGAFASSYNFTANVTYNGIRITSGLLTLKSQTLPPGRVHAVRFRQPLLWRPFGWWSAVVTLAGHGAASGESGAQGSGKAKQIADNVLMPVGSYDDALRVLQLIVRNLGVDDDQAADTTEIPATQTSSTNHGSDYGTAENALLTEAFLGDYKTDTGEQTFTGIGTGAAILDPLARGRRGFAATDTVLIYRDGWLNRQVTIAPHERAQSVTVHAGPIQRARRVATVRLDLVPGLAKMRVAHLSEPVAAKLARQELAASKVRSAVEPNEEWAERLLGQLACTKLDNLANKSHI
ncbi:MAG: PH domain-containing protein [Varibaculum sp.]|nr:PH domain-containing protein [Varibaculum sp.]